MTIEKKIHPEYFQAILDGKKTYELRLGDFDISEGDNLLLKEWDPEKEAYTGRSLTKRVGYVRKWKLDELFWSRESIEEHGLQVISLLD